MLVLLIGLSVRIEAIEVHGFRTRLTVHRLLIYTPRSCCSRSSSSSRRRRRRSRSSRRGRVVVVIAS